MEGVHVAATLGVLSRNLGSVVTVTIGVVTVIVAYLGWRSSSGWNLSGNLGQRAAAWLYTSVLLMGFTLGLYHRVYDATVAILPIVGLAALQRRRWNYVAWFAAFCMIVPWKLFMGVASKWITHSHQIEMIWLGETLGTTLVLLCLFASSALNILKPCGITEEAGERSWD
jgi:hypothetical protein